MLSLIKKIESERTEAKRVPVCAPLLEIEARVGKSSKELRSELNKLYKSGLIEVHETINSKIIISK